MSLMGSRSKQVQKNQFYASVNKIKKLMSLDELGLTLDHTVDDLIAAMIIALNCPEGQYLATYQN